MRSRVLCAIAVLCVLPVLGKGLARPPLEWDSLTYHLVRAAHWVQDGWLSLVPLPDAMDNYNRFPWNGEVLAATFLLPLHGDMVVGLLNLPFLVLLAASLIALGKEFGARPSVRWLVAMGVVSAPVLQNQAHTAHVEIQIAAEVAAAALFVVRAQRGRAATDSLFAAIALGLAIGTKLTAVVPAGFLGAMLAWRISSQKRERLPGCFALLLGLALAAPRYVLNVLETGNPVYPIPVRVLGLALPGSPFDERAMALAGPPAGSDLDAWWSLLPWSSGANAAPGFGPLFAVSAGFAVLFMARARGMALVLGLAWLVPFLAYFASPAAPALRLRRGFPADTPRYLAALLPLCAGLAQGGIASFPVLRWPVTVGLVLVLFGNFMTCDLGSPRLGFEIACATAALVLLGLLLHKRVASTALALLLGVIALPLLATERERTRYEYWAWQGRRVKGSLPQMEAVWRRLDDGGKAQRIAYSVGRVPGRAFWFSYPLYGSRLQNQVVFVRPDRLGAYDPRLDAASLGAGGDYLAWRANLAAERIDCLLLQLPEGAEHALAREHASDFVILDGTENYVLLGLR